MESNLDLLKSQVINNNIETKKKKKNLMRKQTRELKHITCGDRYLYLEEYKVRDCDRIKGYFGSHYNS